jgi:hypothetical protein
LYVHYYYYYYYYYECLSPINDSGGEMYPFKLGRSAVRIAISMQASGLTFDFTGSQFRSFFLPESSEPIFCINKSLP